MAISYLVRRLEENAASENFMSAIFQLGHDSQLFAREEARLRTAVAGITREVPKPRREQEPDRAPDLSNGFVQSTDSDPSLPNIRVWAGEVAEKMKGCELGESTLANNHLDTLPRLMPSLPLPLRLNTPGLGVAGTHVPKYCAR